MYTNKKLEVIQDNAPYTDSMGIKYPSAFPKGEIAELFLVTETPRPADGSIVLGFHIDETHKQVWDVKFKTQEETAAEILNTLKSEAQSELDKSDIVAIRCVKAGVAFPLEWQHYITDLRAVLNGTLTTLPTQPAYPLGS